MNTHLEKPTKRFVDVGLRLHVREWLPVAAERPDFVLLHGLASNARTWDGVATALAARGHRVFAVDQRGHGLSDKPVRGYDFDAVATDLRRLLDALELERPVIAGQSWGANVVLSFGARYAGVAQKLIFVDGGFLELASRGSWDQVSEQLRPPNLVGTPRAQLKAWIGARHPGWGDDALEATLANFETQPDGTVRPWLTYDRHMQILRALYDQHPRALFPQVQEPVLVIVAEDGSDWAARKREQVATAEAALPHAKVVWLEGPHDIHVDQPERLVQELIKFGA
jgi:pimeloyl-ACP methyl ester carboxylesterase